MKQIEKFISHACIYTVFISIAFYIFSDIMNTKGLSMTFARFFTIFAFSMIISSMEYIFSVTRLHKALQYLIHYVTLCFAFVIVFFTIRKTASDFVFEASTIFAAVVLFSFAYGLFFLLAFIARKSISKIHFNTKKSDSKTTDYQSRFK